MLEGTLIYGFINGAMLALIALGFNIVFSISGLANFAYGALYIFAGFVAWIFINSLGLPYFLAIILSVIVTALAGASIYRLVLLRVRGLVLSEIIATFGLGLAILELFKYLGFIGFEYTLPVFLEGSTTIGNTYIDFQRLIILGVSTVLVTLLSLFSHYTKMGLAFRGIAQNEQTALCLGIDSDWMATLSMALGAGLAALAAIVILPLGTISVEGGYKVLIDALTVCIIGGLGSTVGMVVASFIIGYAQMFTASYLEPHWAMVVSLWAIMIVLVIRPSGLFGKQKELEDRI